MLGDSINVTDISLSAIKRDKLAAAIHPVVPPPTITIFLMASDIMCPLYKNLYIQK